MIGKPAGLDSERRHHTSTSVADQLLTRARQAGRCDRRDAQPGGLFDSQTGRKPRGGELSFARSSMAVPSCGRSEIRQRPRWAGQSDSLRDRGCGGVMEIVATLGREPIISTLAASGFCSHHASGCSAYDCEISCLLLRTWVSRLVTTDRASFVRSRNARSPSRPFSRSPAAAYTSSRKNGEGGQNRHSVVASFFPPLSRSPRLSLRSSVRHRRALGSVKSRLLLTSRFPLAAQNGPHARQRTIPGPPNAAGFRRTRGSRSERRVRAGNPAKGWSGRLAFFSSPEISSDRRP